MPFDPSSPRFFGWRDTPADRDSDESMPDHQSDEALPHIPSIAQISSWRNTPADIHSDESMFHSASSPQLPSWRNVPDDRHSDESLSHVASSLQIPSWGNTLVDRNPELSASLSHFSESSYNSLFVHHSNDPADDHSSESGSEISWRSEESEMFPADGSAAISWRLEEPTYSRVDAVRTPSGNHGVAISRRREGSAFPRAVITPPSSQFAEHAAIRRLLQDPMYLRAAASPSHSSGSRYLPALNMIGVIRRFQELDRNGEMSSEGSYFSVDELLGLILAEGLHTLDERHRLQARNALCDLISSFLSASLQK